jgi:hypothetical protein
MTVWKLLGWIIIGIWLVSGIYFEYVLAMRFDFAPPMLTIGFMIGLLFPLEMIFMNHKTLHLLNLTFGPLLHAIRVLLEKEI